MTPERIIEGEISWFGSRVVEISEYGFIVYHIDNPFTTHIRFPLIERSKPNSYFNTHIIIYSIII